MNEPQIEATEEAPPEPEEQPPAPPRWPGSDTLAMVGVSLVGGLFRLYHLADPKSLVFDEVYYAKDACWYLMPTGSACGTSSEITYVHPPLGKWLLALGIRIFGYDSLGWRIAALLAGIATIALLYVIARKLFKSTLAATVTAGLLAFDLLHFVQSRTAMLDIFVPLFGMATVLFLLFDRDRMTKRDPDSRPAAGGLLQRPWRLAAGVMAGCAFASKWSGGFFIALAVLLTLAWEIGVRRRDERPRPILRAVRDELPTMLLWLVVLPLVVYMVTYIGRLEGELFAVPWQQGSWFRALWDRQIAMYNFHKDLVSTHAYQSPPWTWILLKRPVSYFFEAGPDCATNPDCTYKEIVATGSPFVWWSSILAMVYLAVTWVRVRLKTIRDRRPLISDDPLGPEGLILGGFAATYLLWLLPMFNRPAEFLFYILPAVPFMCLALGYIVSRIGESWEARAAVGIFSVATVVLFVFYLPLLNKSPIPKSQWNRRIWEFNNCDKPAGTPVKTTITSTEGGKVKTEATTTTSNDSLPPTGWCWI